MNLDDLKREVWAHVINSSHGKGRHEACAQTIDHLHAQGRIVPDCYVAVPLEPTKKMYEAGTSWYRAHGAISPHIPIGCYKAMIAAAPCPTTGTQAFIDQCNRTPAQGACFAGMPVALEEGTKDKAYMMQDGKVICEITDLTAATASLLNPQVDAQKVDGK